jgi:hypothetical protein
VKKDDGLDYDISCDVATIKDVDSKKKIDTDEDIDAKIRHAKTCIRNMRGSSSEEDEYTMSEEKERRRKKKARKRALIKQDENNIVKMTGNLIVIIYNLIRCILIILFNCISAIINKSMSTSFNVVNKMYKFITKAEKNKTLQATDIKEENKEDLSNDDPKEYSYDSDDKDE